MWQSESEAVKSGQGGEEESVFLYSLTKEKRADFSLTNKLHKSDLEFGGRK